MAARLSLSKPPLPPKTPLSLLSLKCLTLETLDKIDYGKGSMAFQCHLARAVHDCIDRPGDKRARKITIQLNLCPVAEINGTQIDCDSISGTVKVASKIPDHETNIIDFGIDGNGNLLFNPDSPGNHRQTTMLDDE